jgi:hypothetical protein
VLSCIKAAKYYEMDENDVMITILTDSMELYRSRLHEMHQEFGEYTERTAAADFARYLQGQSTDNMLELRYPDRRRVHNLKYYTWVEQQGSTYEEIQQQWYQPNYWTRLMSSAKQAPLMNIHAIETSIFTRVDRCKLILNSKWRVKEVGLDCHARSNSHAVPLFETSQRSLGCRSSKVIFDKQVQQSSKSITEVTHGADSIHSQLS